MIAVPNIAEFIGVRSGCLAWAESRVKCDGVRGGGGEGREDRGTRGGEGNLAERDPLWGRGRGPLRRKQGRRVWLLSGSASRRHSGIDCHIDCWPGRSHCLRTAVGCSSREFLEAAVAC